MDFYLIIKQLKQFWHLRLFSKTGMKQKYIMTLLDVTVAKKMCAPRTYDVFLAYP